MYNIEIKKYNGWLTGRLKMTIVDHQRTDQENIQPKELREKYSNQK